MKKIGFVVAIHRELQAVFAKYGQPKEEINIPGYNIFVYEIKDKEVYIIHSGCGNIASSSATQVLISLFNVEMIVNFGVVGGLDDSLLVDDVIIVEKVVHYDFDTSEIDVGIRKHQYERFDSEFIPVNKDIIDKVKEILPSAKFVIDASGDKFIGNSEAKRNLNQSYGAHICEMEAAGILLTSIRNNVPCLLIKAVSDDVNGGGVDFAQNVSNAALKAVNLVFSVLEKF